MVSFPNHIASVLSERGLRCESVYYPLWFQRLYLVCFICIFWNFPMWVPVTLRSGLVWFYLWIYKSFLSGKRLCTIYLFQKLFKKQDIYIIFPNPFINDVTLNINLIPEPSLSLQPSPGLWLSRKPISFLTFTNITPLEEI